MLHRLIASQPARVSGAGSTTFSALSHVSLIALAIALTGPATGGVARGRLHELTTPTPVRYVSMPRRAGAVSEAVRRARDAFAHAARAAARSKLARLSLDAASIVRPIDVPDIDLDAAINLMTASWLAAPDGLADSGSVVATLGTLFGPPATGTPSGGAYTPEMVERIVAPAPGNPEPQYPEPLRRQGIEEKFVVRFIVDTTGQVDEHDIQFPRTTHRLFVEAVKTALLRSHYRPATLGGRPVPQLVEQEFRFQMVR